MKHLADKILWIQQKTEDSSVFLRRVGPVFNVADIATKCLSKQTLLALNPRLNFWGDVVNKLCRLQKLFTSWGATEWGFMSSTFFQHSLAMPCFQNAIFFDQPWHRKKFPFLQNAASFSTTGHTTTCPFATKCSCRFQELHLQRNAFATKCHVGFYKTCIQQNHPKSIKHHHRSFLSRSAPIPQAVYPRLMPVAPTT